MPMLKIRNHRTEMTLRLAPDELAATSIIIVWQASELCANLSKQEKREKAKTRGPTGEEIQHAEDIATMLQRFKHGYITRAQPHWRWDLDTRYDVGNDVIQAVWDRYGIFTVGSELLASLLLPYARIQDKSGLDLAHARHIEQWAVDVPFIHDRWVRAVSNFMIQRIHVTVLPEVDLSIPASVMETPTGPPDAIHPLQFPPLGMAAPPKVKAIVARWDKVKHTPPDLASPKTTTPTPAAPVPQGKAPPSKQHTFPDHLNHYKLPPPPKHVPVPQVQATAVKTPPPCPPVPKESAAVIKVDLDENIEVEPYDDDLPDFSDEDRAYQQLKAAEATAEQQQQHFDPTSTSFRPSSIAPSVVVTSAPAVAPTAPEQEQPNTGTTGNTCELEVPTPTPMQVDNHESTAAAATAAAAPDSTLVDPPGLDPLWANWTKSITPGPTPPHGVAPASLPAKAVAPTRAAVQVHPDIRTRREAFPAHNNPYNSNAGRCYESHGFGIALLKK